MVSPQKWITFPQTPLLAAANLQIRTAMRFHPIVSSLLAASFCTAAFAASAEDTTAIVATGGCGLRGRVHSSTPNEVIINNDRSLMEMDMYGPLMCNTGASPAITSDDYLANATPLSSLINNAVSSSAANVVVPCGSCVTVDYTDSSTVTLPGDGSLQSSHQGPLALPTNILCYAQHHCNLRRGSFGHPQDQ